MARRADIPGLLATLDGTNASTPSTQSLHPSIVTGATSVRAGGATPLPSPPSHPAHLPASVQPSLLLLQGKLLRRDRTFLTWKWRDVYLEQHRLQYFNEKGVRKGEIMITPTTPIVIRLLNEPKPHGFLVFIKDEKLTLAAATAQDRQKWIDVFKDVFHANVEDCQTTKSGVVDKQEKKRTRPTFLPIPDMTSEDEVAPTLAASGSRTPTANQGGTSITTRISLLGLGRLSEGALTSTSVAAVPATASSTAVAPAVVATAASTSAGPSGEERRSLFRNSEALEISAPRSKFIALKEHYSSVTFPRTLANGDVLVGVGPLVRRMGWTDERILAVGLYVDPDAAVKELHRFHSRNLKSLRGDQSFYDYLVQHSKFRRSFVVTSRKRVSKSVLIALLHDEIAPRVSGSTDALHTFLGFIEKSLRKAESLMLRIHPDGGRLEFRLRGQQYPPIASSMLCQCIQAIFFDVNSIQQDAKRRLIERFPLLWGIEDPEDVLLALGGSDRDMHGHQSGAESKERDGGDGTPSDSDEDDDDYDGEEEGGDEMRHHPRGQGRRRSTSSAAGRDRSSSQPIQLTRGMSIKEKLDELDEQEHERMRRESRSLGVHFAPILDKESNAYFRGDLLVDGSALLGTWSRKISYTTSTTGTRDSLDDSTVAAATADERSCVVSVGLYAEPGGASEALLKYKGLSVGSILQDPDFFARFADGPFTKHLMFKVLEPLSVTTLIEYFTARVRRRGSGAGAPGATGDSGRSSDAKVRALLERLEEQHVGDLRPEDELQVTILTDRRMTLRVTRPLAMAEDDEEQDAKTQYPSINDMNVAAAPFSTVFQGIFYGYHTVDPASRAQLLERLPSLLDLAKDDLAHTYHDEIQVLKENYKRQLPEFRLKAGYLLISFEKKKMARNAEGIKEQTITAAKWSKRWCRLDGATFSYFSHKRSKKPRDIVDLTLCTVSEITPASTSIGLAPFAIAKNTRPSIRIGIAKPNGEIVALKTESIYEGTEWLESLVEASNVIKKLDSSGLEEDVNGIETSGGGDADESSGAMEMEDEVDTGIDGRMSGEDGEYTVTSSSSVRSPISVNSSVKNCKRGSLVSWIREDSRHAFIFALLVVLTWVVTSQQPQQFIHVDGRK